MPPRGGGGEASRCQARGPRPAPPACDPRIGAPRRQRTTDRGRAPDPLSPPSGERVRVRGRVRRHSRLARFLPSLRSPPSRRGPSPGQAQRARGSRPRSAILLPPRPPQKWFEVILSRMLGGSGMHPLWVRGVWVRAGCRPSWGAICGGSGSRQGSLGRGRSGWWLRPERRGRGVAAQRLPPVPAGRAKAPAPHHRRVVPRPRRMRASGDRHGGRLHVGAPRGEAAPVVEENRLRPAVRTERRRRSAPRAFRQRARSSSQLDPGRPPRSQEARRAGPASRRSGLRRGGWNSGPHCSD